MNLKRNRRIGRNLQLIKKRLLQSIYRRIANFMTVSTRKRLKRILDSSLLRSATSKLDHQTTILKSNNGREVQLSL